MATTGVTHRHDIEDAVVLVNCAGGNELVGVHDALIHAFGTPSILISREDLTTLPISLDLSTGVLDVDGRRVRPAVVWIRHSSTGAMAAQARPGGMRPLDAAAWSGLLEHLAASASAALPGRSPAGPGQLVDAARLGVTIPRTVVTTDIRASARRLATDLVMVKTPDFRIFEPDRSAWSGFLPRIVDPRTGLEARPAEGRPVVVQEYVTHDRELRVYYLDGGICAFEIGKSTPSSLWTDPDRVTVARIDCPPPVAATVRTLCLAWRLRYGAFDLLVSPTGELVFLEANPDGDWLWFERKARWYGVSFMAAVMVRELFVRSTSLGVRADDCDAR
jgi:hypothetical protein